MPADFADVMKSVSQVVKTDESHVYLMLSGARTAQPDMDKYVKGAVDAGLRVVGEGKFTKLTKAGKPVTNVRGVEAAAERMILLTKSGVARPGSIEKTLDFRFIRPAIAKSYQTEKPEELMKALIEQSTLEGETVLDPFAGSGVTGAEAIKSGRNAVLIEKSKETVENFTKPRVEAAAKELDQKATEQAAKTGGQIISGAGPVTTEPVAKVPTTESEFNALSPEELLQQIADSLLGRREARQRGFINISQIVADADAKVKDFVNSTMKPIELTSDLTDSISRLEGAAQADLEAANNLVKNIDINKADDEALYTHAEDPNAPLNARQKALEEQFDKPLRDMNQKLFERIKRDGVPMEGDENYIARFAKEKASVMQRVFNPSKGRTPTATQGGVLSKSTSSFKNRVYKSLVNVNGKRRVVAIKDGEVTGFNDKKEGESLGRLDARITPKVKEFFDKNVMPKLEKLASDLGITHERHTGYSKGLGGSRAGVSFGGKNLIKTRVATPERVILHEIGHQLDERYGLQEIFSKDDDRNFGVDTTKKEMRAIADLRIEGLEVGKDVSKHFANSYIRSAPEKIAAMFEAYLHVPDKFEKVAPNVFEKFEAFLAAHKELQPILAIKPSLVLGSQTLGGDLIAGKKGNVFIDKEGNKYTIDEATTKEIEASTNTEYYHSALASRVLQYVKLRQIDRANQFLNAWKESPEFAQIAVPSDQIPPQGWKMTSQINFRNYYFEPRVAEALDDMQKKMEGGMYNDAFQGINRMLANAIFFNGLAHPINVAVTWAYARGASSLVNPKAYASGYKAFGRAMTALSTKNEDYLELLRTGAHLMSSDVTNKKLAENLMAKVADEIDSKPELRDRLLKILGYAGEQANFRTNVIYKLSHNMAWLSNDLLTMQSIFENMDRRGISMEEAIKETSRFIPDYR